jgi:hypothetical protein
MTTANDLTFGIEIECSIPYAAMAQKGWVVGSYSSGAAIPNHDGWKAKSDCSIRAEAGCTALEVVSPVLKGAEGIEAVKKMIKQLNEMGAKVNASTGFHCHVGCKGDLAVIRRLVALVSNNEQAIYASTGTKTRETAQWCRSIKTKLKPIYDEASQASLRRVAGTHHDRYHILNLTNIVTGVRNAVEFRAFAGTTNINKILGYICMCIGIVERAHETSKACTWDAKPVGDHSSLKRDGDGETALARLAMQMGWKNAPSGSRVFGVVEGVDMKAACKELFRLAAKYDGRDATSGRPRPPAEIAARHAN